MKRCVARGEAETKARSRRVGLGRASPRASPRRRLGNATFWRIHPRRRQSCARVVPQAPCVWSPPPPSPRAPRKPYACARTEGRASRTRLAPKQTRRETRRGAAPSAPPSTFCPGSPTPDAPRAHVSRAFCSPPSPREAPPRRLSCPRARAPARAVASRSPRVPAEAPRNDDARPRACASRARGALCANGARSREPASRRCSRRNPALERLETQSCASPGAYPRRRRGRARGRRRETPRAKGDSSRRGATASPRAATGTPTSFRHRRSCPPGGWGRTARPGTRSAANAGRPRRAPGEKERYSRRCRRRRRRRCRRRRRPVSPDSSPRRSPPWLATRRPRRGRPAPPARIRPAGRTRTPGRSCGTAARVVWRPGSR